jgi:hypothetical protein
VPDPLLPEDDDAAHTSPERARSARALFVTDAEIIRRLGVSQPVGYRALHELDRRHALSGFPQKDPLWGNRRLWPKVVKWLMADDRPATAAAPVNWEENFNAKPPRQWPHKRKLVPRTPPPG